MVLWYIIYLYKYIRNVQSEFQIWVVAVALPGLILPPGAPTMEVTPNSMSYAPLPPFQGVQNSK